MQKMLARCLRSFPIQEEEDAPPEKKKKTRDELKAEADASVGQSLVNQLHSAPAAPSPYLRSAHDAGMVTKLIFASVGTTLLQAYEKISAVIPRLLECCNQFSDAVKLTLDGQGSDGGRLDASKASHQKAFEVFGRLMGGALAVCKAAPDLEFSTKLAEARPAHQEHLAAQARSKPAFAEKIKEEKPMSELTKPIEEAFSQMTVPGESGGHLTRFARENYYLTSFKQAQDNTKHFFNSFRNVENANEFIDAVKRDPNRLNDVTKELKDNVTELALHFDVRHREGLRGTYLGPRGPPRRN